VDVKSLQTLFAVSLIAALAPIIVAALPRPRIPQVVVLILCGVIIGNQGLGLQKTDSIKLISNVGLGFLFLLAGYELDPQLLREQAGKLAITGWVLSAVIAVGAVAILGSFGYVHDFVPIGLALTTTALGTLLPILSDNDMLAGEFGRYVLAAGAVGELLPILAISLFLTDRAQWAALISIAAVCVVALLLTFLPRVVGEGRLRAVIEQGQRSTAQTTLRWSMVDGRWWWWCCCCCCCFWRRRASAWTWCWARCWPAWCCAAGPGGWGWRSPRWRKSSTRWATASSSRSSSSRTA
jgi:Kef-type K+ transport system membrane component KefB